MRIYILFAVLGYLAFAVNSVIDKYLLKKSIKEPVTYAFYIGLLSGSVVLLFPFDFSVPSSNIMALAFASGVCFVGALIAFFEGLKFEDASKVLPVVGASVPVFTFAFGFLLVGERLQAREIAGLAMLVVATLLLGTGGILKEGGRRWLAFAVVAALLFALSFALAKVVYLHQSFVSGLIWTRLGMVLAAFAILLWPKSRQEIFHTTLNLGNQSKALFFSGQFLAAGGGVLQNYALSLGSVTLVNALQSTQFGFLFALTWFLSAYFPQVLHEDFSTSTILKKVLSLLLIMFGLLLIM